MTNTNQTRLHPIFEGLINGLRPVKPGTFSFIPEPEEIESAYVPTQSDIEEMSIKLINTAHRATATGHGKGLGVSFTPDVITVSYLDSDDTLVEYWNIHTDPATMQDSKDLSKSHGELSDALSFVCSLLNEVK